LDPIAANGDNFEINEYSRNNNLIMARDNNEKIE